MKTLIGGVCALGLLVACSPQPETVSLDVAQPADLAAQSAEFPRSIEVVAPGIWAAIGYGLANSLLVEGTDGLIVIDTMATLEEGRAVAAEFRKLSDKPLKAIIYTHNHADHVFGAQAFVDVLADDGVPVQVLAHESTADYVYRVASEYRPILSARSFRMFGTALDDAGFINNGLGPRLAIDADSAFGFVAPNRTFAERLTTTIAGVDLELVHAPGETADQIFVWLPQTRTLAVGDNLYKAFPNLYTIRGTPYRSPKDWAASIDKMRALPVEHVAPSHTRPLHGAEQVQTVLTNYRDAIRYVHDQTVRWTNAGLTPDEIVERVQLPPHLAREPYLQPFYGTPRWSVRSVFAGNLGWFDGNPAQLDPLPPLEEAQRVVQLAGGADAMKEQLGAALKAGEEQWALQLSDWLLRVLPDDATVRQQRVTALTRLGERASNPNARHYYLMSALELRDGRRLKAVSTGTPAMLRSIPMESIMTALATNLRAEDTLQMDRKVVIRFSDTGEAWTLWVRRGVLETIPAASADAEIDLTVDSLIWKQMLSRQISPAVAIAREMQFDRGGVVGFSRFMLLFRPVREAPEPAPFAALEG